MSKWVGLYAVDPGGTSGVSWGVFPVKGSTKGQVSRACHRGCTEVAMAEAKGLVPNAMSGEQAAAALIVDSFLAFREECDSAGVPARLIIEDFFLYPKVLKGEGGSSQREGIAPARIASAMEAHLWNKLEGMAWTVGVRYQMASEAKGYCTNDRLKRWGLWEVGKPHARDAARHLALGLAKASAEMRS